MAVICTQQWIDLRNNRDVRYCVGSGLDRMIGACIVVCAYSSGRSTWWHGRNSSLHLKLVSTKSTCDDVIIL